MGKKGGWFSAVKKALSAESKEKKDQVWMVFIYALLSQTKEQTLMLCILQLDLFPIIATKIRL
jgi:hypothetical protein